ncbi:MAG: hypothetical protein K2Y22_03965 [Candidatus Obscuribacterales bacterium]|nr:hypothetical protein [Candidatus Obscuribacterales bacterium]
MHSATFDTNVYPLDSAITQLVKEHGFSCAHISVTERELYGTTIERAISSTIPETAVWNESYYDHSVYGPVTIPESWVLGESELGTCSLAGNQEVDVLELILSIIGNNSFPQRGKRTHLSKGQRRQLRDAMILTAHVRDQRDIFVSNDTRAFVNNGRREILQDVLKTKIMTKAEFLDYLKSFKTYVPQKKNNLTS